MNYLILGIVSVKFLVYMMAGIIAAWLIYAVLVYWLEKTGKV